MSLSRCRADGAPRYSYRDDASNCGNGDDKPTPYESTPAAADNDSVSAVRPRPAVSRRLSRSYDRSVCHASRRSAMVPSVQDDTASTATAAMLESAPFTRRS